MQQWDINLIIDLQRALRSPFFDYLFYAISIIGSEYFILAAAIIIYWCFSKRYAYKLFNIYVVGSIFVGAFKAIAARPRPFECGAEAVISKTEGYSFPSGHSQSTANIATQFSILAHKKGSKMVFIVTLAVFSFVTALVMFSRMYLGQHYLTDVLAGAALGVSIAFLFSSLFELLKDREEMLFIVVLPLTVILAAVFIGLNRDFDGFAKIAGVLGAMSLGYFLEKRFVGYEVKSGNILKQVVKVLAGILVVLLLKEGLSYFFKALGVSGRFLMVTDFLRYFLMGIFASFVAPAAFKQVRL